MDSHVLRKASWRLPALADVAVLRFNTRGTTQRRRHERGRLRLRRGRGARPRGRGRRGAAPWAARRLAARLVLRHRRRAAARARRPGSSAGCLLSPPLRHSTDADLDRWAADGRPLTALVPEHDDYLRPAEARERFARVPQAEVVGVDGAKHLWVGEPYVRRVLDEVVARVVGPGADAAADDVAGSLHDAFRPCRSCTVTIDLAGKTAIVTGASRGIGKAIALAYAEAGADVALVARDAERLEEVASRRARAGRKAFVLPCDVTDEEAVHTTVAAAIDAARARRRRREQRRRQQLLRRLRGHADERVRQGAAAQPPVHGVRLPGGRPAPARAEVRLGHQRGVGGRPARDPVHGALRRGQGCGAVAHHHAGHGVGVGERPGQRPAARAGSRPTSPTSPAPTRAPRRP